MHVSLYQGPNELTMGSWLLEGHMLNPSAGTTWLGKHGPEPAIHHVLQRQEHTATLFV